MDEQALSLRELLDQAAASASLGEREEAEQQYRRATERSPGNSEAWLGLAASTPSLEEKRAAYEQVLVINPNNGEARVALQRLATQADPEQAQAIRETLNRPVSQDVPRPAGSGARSSSNDGHEHVPVDTGEVTYCVNHPDTETTLRCNRCGRPVCLKCVKLTDVGYRCKDCIREQQNSFFNAENTDYIIVAVVSFFLAAIAGPIIGALLGIFGLFFGIIIAVFLGPAVGGIAATIIRRSVGRRRGRYMGIVAVVAIILGVAVGAFGGILFGRPPNLITMGVFLFLSLSTIYASLR
ncbi:MAG: tetratricopeptide repeat protein [Caldilineae bacterium]|nr:tetratricopeptide repeat protein [Anaerolineae bacterium]MCB0254290.1 tetratricopeptide repeat protein [Anaerolineae bacterium]MCB9152770.1 tetratricopeptide repeat protein [Caldilineae bacterium]